MFDRLSWRNYQFIYFRLYLAVMIKYKSTPWIFEFVDKNISSQEQKVLYLTNVEGVFRSTSTSFSIFWTIIYLFVSISALQCQKAVYMLTFKGSRYCLLSLHGKADSQNRECCKMHGILKPKRSHLHLLSFRLRYINLTEHVNNIQINKLNLLSLHGKADSQNRECCKMHGILKPKRSHLHLLSFRLRYINLTEHVNNIQINKLNALQSMSITVNRGGIYSWQHTLKLFTFLLKPVIV